MDPHKKFWWEVSKSDFKHDWILLTVECKGFILLIHEAENEQT